MRIETSITLPNVVVDAAFSENARSTNGEVIDRDSSSRTRQRLLGAGLVASIASQ